MGLYSQNDEDEVIFDYFDSRYKPGQVGYFVDIGANDGINLSNTKNLSDIGWTGCCVEPDQGAYQALLKNRQERVLSINAAMGDTTGQVSFNASKDSLLSTLKDELMPRWSHVTTFSKTTVQCYSWPDFLIKFGIDERNINFISIDAEGMDWIILLQMDLTNLECLCIEYGDKEQNIIDYCSLYGMKRIYKSAENLIFVK